MQTREILGVEESTVVEPAEPVGLSAEGGVEPVRRSRSVREAGLRRDRPAPRLKRAAARGLRPSGLGAVADLSPSKLRLLLASEDRRSELDAKLAFARDRVAMALQLPTITERGQIVAGGEVVSTYALWEDINEVLRPLLTAHGFALSFRTAQEAEAVVVTAILSHRDGHSEETTLRLPPDPGPSRNSVQAVGSSVSYGKRYTACALLNITTRGEDDDGRAAGGVITPEQVHELEEGIAEAKTSRKRFLRYLKVESLELLPSARFADAKAALVAKAQNAGGAQ